MIIPKDEIEQISNSIVAKLAVLIDTKLEPMANDLSAVKNDLANVKTHVTSINERLYKLEKRMANIEVKLDACLSATVLT